MRWVIIVILLFAALLALRWKDLKVLLMPSGRLERQVRRGRGRRGGSG